ncbi:MAG: GDP-mannose 4,6-dehydratase, partial [Planctomycetota bacterium]
MDEITLVTGGAGFVGTHFVERLLAEGAGVRILDNFSTGRRENLVELRDRVEVLEGDIRDLDVVKKAVDGASNVIHLAALPSVHRSIAAPIESNEVNVTGTLNVLVAAR